MTYYVFFCYVVKLTESFNYRTAIIDWATDSTYSLALEQMTRSISNISSYPAQCHSLNQFHSTDDEGQL